MSGILFAIGLFVALSVPNIAIAIVQLSEHDWNVREWWCS